MKELKKKSASLLKKIIMCGLMNVMTLVIVGLLVTIMKKRYLIPELKALDPANYNSDVAYIKMLLVAGVIIAFLPVLISLLFVNQRSKVQQEILELKNKEMDNLDLKT